ncbi:MAG: serine/threonine protein kinase [Verrucomicrobia bacterium]|nr:serine/threonine protein kinase [Verrucomicrobiota bacterium]
MENLEGQTFAGYEVHALLGRGGMGAVYRARQPLLNRIVALKVISPAVAQDPEFLARFHREATAAAKLSHSNIVLLYTAGTCDGVPYMACEFVEGETLQAKLDRRGRLDPREALAICVFVAQALDHAWQKAQIVHRDIKPDNIFLSSAGEVKVGDFGLAKSIGGPTMGLTKTGTTLGTPNYMSPEQALGQKEIDFRADIYSLGCVLYHLLSGQLPYASASVIEVMTQQAYGPPLVITQVMSDCTVPLALLVGKMVAKDPNARHPSYEELIADLHRVRAFVRPPDASIACAPAVQPRLTPRVVKPGVNPGTPS